jgi:hypothetical protein
MKFPTFSGHVYALPHNRWDISAMFYQKEPNSAGYRTSSTHGHSVSSLQQLVDIGRLDMITFQNSANAEIKHTNG